MKFAELGLIEDRVQTGGWVGDLPNLPGIKLKVRGLANPDYQRLRTKLQSALVAGVEPDPERVAADDAHLLSETILVNWHGFEDMVFNDRAVAEALKSSVFRTACFYASSVVAGQGKNDLEEITKNSSPPYAGSSAGAGQSATTKR